MTSPDPSEDTETSSEDAAPPAQDAERPADAAEEPEPAGNPAYAPVPPPLPPDNRRQKVLGFGAAGLVVLALVGYLTWNAVNSSAEGVVANYFEAIIAKDVEAAFGYVEGEIPYGDEAVFLDPKAIADDWRLVDTEAKLDRSAGSTVAVTLEHDGEQETRDIEVSDISGEWQVADPFIRVSIAAGALTYLQVNDKVVELDRLYAQDVSGLAYAEYLLFPGLTRFFGDMRANATKPDPAELMFPPGEGLSDTVPVLPPDFTITEAAREGLQKAVDRHIDDCAESTVRLPAACPFGVESSFQPDDDHYYSDIHDVTWTVTEYPTVALTTDYEDKQYSLGVQVGTDDPGQIELKATASLDDDSVKLDVKCRFDTGTMRVAFDPDGEPHLYAQPLAGTAIAMGPWQVDSCSKPDRDGR